MRTSATRRESLLAEFERSGLSAAKFAELAGIKYQTFAGWVQQRRRTARRPVPTPGPSKWLEAVVEQAQVAAATNGAALLLQLPGGVQVELVDARQVPLAAALVRALQKPC
jgi:hypothetical protein